VKVGDEIINDGGETALVHIMLGDEVVAKRKDKSLFTFKIGNGDWIVYKSKLVEFISVIDGLSVEELQDRLLKLRQSKAVASIARRPAGRRKQSEPAMSKADKELLKKVRSLTPEQIKELKGKIAKV